jgi:hypothetical protein
VYTDPQEVLVTCSLSGIQEKDPDIHFELLDASSHQLENDTVRLDGQLITERVSRAQDIVSETKERVKGYEGTTSWKPPITEFGYYRVRVSMQTSRGTLKDHVISVAVVPPIEQAPHGEFGWSLAGDDQPLTFKELENLLPRVGISWLKLPVWYGETEQQRGEELVFLAELLAAKDIEVVGVIDRPPMDLSLGKRIAGDITIADLLSVEDTSSWLPSLDAVLTRLSLRVRWWQLGNDRDTSFSSFPKLESEIAKLRGKLFRFGQDVNVGIGWPWNLLPRTEKEATWDFQQFSTEPAMTGAELAAYLQLPKRDLVTRWVLIDPLDKRYYDLESRTRDLVEQMLASKIEGADGIFVAAPFDDMRGIMTDAGTPGELLLPWRTTASLLSGAQYIGSIQMPNNSENRIFETARGDVLMVVWNKVAIQEVMYLGDEVRVVDVWGRATSPAIEEHRQVIEVGSLPTFVIGLNPYVAHWRMSTRFTNLRVPSVFGKAHKNDLVVKNHFPQGVGGTVNLVAPEGWQLVPGRLDFKLSITEEAKRPFQVVLPFNAYSGDQPVRADFTVVSDRTYKFSVYRELNVGDEDIEVELTTRFDKTGALLVEQRMVNHAQEPVDFKCFMYARDRRRQRMQVFRLSNSHDVKTYTFQNGRELIGSELRLSAEEIEGTRVLNYSIKVEE